MCQCNRRLTWCLFVVALVFCSVAKVRGLSLARTKRESVEEAQQYLMQFGYMDKSTDGAFALRTEDSFRRSLTEMQKFAGLPETGRLDERTVALLKTPRCGLPDKEVGQTSGRTKRFTIHGPKWPYTNLTWSIRSKNLGKMQHYEVRYVISKALDVWSKHSKLQFTEVDSDKADILIYFYRRNHGDNFPFDGRGMVLAHAFFPTGVRSSIEVHFDGDESWTTSGDSEQGTNLFNVAAHEVGHSLGLAHSDVESALMYPWYKEIADGFEYELPEDDKQAIQHLYGARDDRQSWANIPHYRPPQRPATTTTTTTTTPRPTPRYRQPYPRYPDERRPYNPRPDYHYPSKPRTPEKKPLYPTKTNVPGYPHDRNPMHPKNIPGKNPDWYHPERGHPDRNYPVGNRPDRKYPERKYPERTHPPRVYPTNNYPDKYPSRNPERHNPERKPHAHPDHPKESPTRKPPPDTCDTSYDAVAVIRREMFIFKDAYLWRISDKGLMKGYPVEIRRLWRDLPQNLTHVDAVYERPDGKIVFFIDDQFYVSRDIKIEYGYPQPLTELGLPRRVKKIDGAMVWGHNGRTYFYSGNEYWSFDEQIQKVDLDYPRKMTMWKGVEPNIDAVFQWKDGKTYFFKDKGFWKFNDLLMKVEHTEQKLSAPFWMGCTKNYEENEVGDKLPYRNEFHLSSGALTHSNNFVLLATINLIVCLRYKIW